MTTPKLLPNPIQPTFEGKMYVQFDNFLPESSSKYYKLGLFSTISFNQLIFRILVNFFCTTSVLLKTQMQQVQQIQKKPVFLGELSSRTLTPQLCISIEIHAMNCELLLAVSSYFICNLDASFRKKGNTLRQN